MSHRYFYVRLYEWICILRFHLKIIFVINPDPWIMNLLRLQKISCFAISTLFRSPYFAKNKRTLGILYCIAISTSWLISLLFCFTLYYLSRASASVRKPQIDRPLSKDKQRVVETLIYVIDTRHIWETAPV